MLVWLKKPGPEERALAGGPIAPCGRGLGAGLQRRARLGGERAGELAPPQGGVRLCLEKDSSW